jgi:hypothetical protein
MTEKNFTVNQERTAEEVVAKPKIHLDELDTYKSAVEDLRLELTELIQDGYMTETVAERVINEFMYTAFSTIVKLNLH